MPDSSSSRCQGIHECEGRVAKLRMATTGSKPCHLIAVSRVRRSNNTIPDGNPWIELLPSHDSGNAIFESSGPNHFGIYESARSLWRDVRTPPLWEASHPRPHFLVQNGFWGRQVGSCWRSASTARLFFNMSAFFRL